MPQAHVAAGLSSRCSNCGGGLALSEAKVGVTCERCLREAAEGLSMGGPVSGRHAGGGTPKELTPGGTRRRPFTRSLAASRSQVLEQQREAL